MRIIRIPAVEFHRIDGSVEVVEHGTEGRARQNAMIYGMPFIWVEKRVPSIWDRIRGHQ